MGNAPAVPPEEMARRQRVGRQFVEEVMRILRKYGISGRAEAVVRNALTGEFIRLDGLIEDTRPFGKFVIEIKVSAEYETYKKAVRQVAGRYTRDFPGAWDACRHEVQMLSPALEENSQQLMVLARRFAGRYLTKYRYWVVGLTTGGIILSLSKVASADPSEQGAVALEEGYDWGMGLAFWAAVSKVLGGAGAGYVAGAMTYANIYNATLEANISIYGPNIIIQLAKHRH